MLQLQSPLYEGFPVARCGNCLSCSLNWPFSLERSFSVLLGCSSCVPRSFAPNAYCLVFTDGRTGQWQRWWSSVFLYSAHRRYNSRNWIDYSPSGWDGDTLWSTYTSTLTGCPCLCNYSDVVSPLCKGDWRRAWHEELHRFLLRPHGSHVVRLIRPAFRCLLHWSAYYYTGLTRKRLLFGAKAVILCSPFSPSRLSVWRFPMVLPSVSCTVSCPVSFSCRNVAAHVWRCAACFVGKATCRSAKLILLIGNLKNADCEGR